MLLVLLVMMLSMAHAPAIAGVVYRTWKPLEVGEKIGPRNIDSLGGELLNWPAEEGLTVVLFWATWSPRSQEALSLWQGFLDTYAQHPLTVITINADNQRMTAEDVEKVKAYIVANDITLPVAIDSGLTFFGELGVMVNPTALFFEPDGTLVYKLASLPSSARLDLVEELEVRLGIARRQTEEEKGSRGKLEYQPENNALLYYNMGQQLAGKGFSLKARDKYIEALKRDPDYRDPLQALVRLFLSEDAEGSRKRLEEYLAGNGLHYLVEKVEWEAADTEEASPTPAPAATAAPAEKKLSPMEKMKLLMEKQ
jgi:thiol-disulfide isomerase/thioredoxin